MEGSKTVLLQGTLDLLIPRHCGGHGVGNHLDLLRRTPCRRDRAS
jgi:hypothetical protein